MALTVTRSELEGNLGRYRYGYMEMYLNKSVDGSGAPPILDFHRFVLLFSHRFSDRLRFVGELEVEHARRSNGTGAKPPWRARAIAGSIQRGGGPCWRF